MPVEVCRNRKKVQPLSGQVSSGCEYAGHPHKTASCNGLECAARRSLWTSRLPFVSPCYHPYNCPPAIPAVYSVAMRKNALLIFSRHVSLSITAPLRSVLGRGFVLFRSGGKTSIQCATPAVLKEKECI